MAKKTMLFFYLYGIIKNPRVKRESRKAQQTVQEVKMAEKSAPQKMSGFEKLEKAELKRIEISQLPKEIPDFKNAFESKDSIIKKWLTDWISAGIKKGGLEVNTLLPKKQDIAYYLGVSVGTVQNAIRSVEDAGFLESKQRIGTIIRGSNASNPIIRKASSKREKVITQIKKHLIDNGIKVNDPLPSARFLAAAIGNSTNTIRLALDYLYSQGVIEPKAFRSNESNWVLKKTPVFSDAEMIDLKKEAEEISADTLVDKVEQELKDYIRENFKIGDRLPAHKELSETLKVSIKTVHDAMKALIDGGYLLARRGRYGTTIIKIPDSNTPDNILQPLNETSIFASAQEAAFYSYQKIENTIKNFIKDNYEIGDKLPSMDELSKQFDVSSNTTRKALQNLAKQGIVNFSRGRYGGTFVTDLPETDGEEAFRWLAVSPNYTISYDNEN